MLTELELDSELDENTTSLARKYSDLICSSTRQKGLKSGGDMSSYNSKGQEIVTEKREKDREREVGKAGVRRLGLSFDS